MVTKKNIAIIISTVALLLTAGTVSRSSRGVFAVEKIPKFVLCVFCVFLFVCFVVFVLLFVCLFLFSVRQNTF
jgi:hypothetical protein